MNDASIERSTAFCDWLFTHVCGEARVRLGGEIAGFDRECRTVFVEGRGQSRKMPAGEFLAYLSAAETKELDDLPDYNGRNAWELSRAVLHAANLAIQRRGAGQALKEARAKLEASQSQEDGRRVEDFERKYEEAWGDQ